MFAHLPELTYELKGAVCVILVVYIQNPYFVLHLIKPSGL